MFPLSAFPCLNSPFFSWLLFNCFLLFAVLDLRCSWLFFAFFSIRHWFIKQSSLPLPVPWKLKAVSLVRNQSTGKCSAECLRRPCIETSAWILHCRLTPFIPNDAPLFRSTVDSRLPLHFDSFLVTWRLQIFPSTKHTPPMVCLRSPALTAPSMCTDFPDDRVHNADRVLSFTG